MKRFRTLPIYTDPSAGLGFEGEAYLIKRLWVYKALEFWKVEFVADGRRCHRAAIVKKTKSELLTITTDTNRNT